MKLLPWNIEEFKRVAIWGTALSGLSCLHQLKACGIEVAYFIDRNPPEDGLCEGVPVRSTQEFVMQGDESLDALFLAMRADTTEPRRLLKASGFQQPVVHTTHGIGLDRLFASQRCLQQALAYDGGDEDRKFLRQLHEVMVQKDSRWVWYGSGKFSRYFLSQVPEAASIVSCILDDDPAKTGTFLEDVPVVHPGEPPAEVTSVLLASTRSRTIQKMRHRLGEKSSVRLQDLVDQIPVEELPSHIWREPVPSIYPVDLPEIEVDRDLDFLLLDLPARFLGMMPNGLGFVHNLLKKTGIRFQTIDLDILLYHRFHSERILDGVHPADGEDIPSDPWAIDSLEDQWKKPALWNYFEEDFETLIQQIVQARPKMLGISLHATNLEIARRVVERVRREHPDVVVVVGGYDCVYPDVGPRLFSDYDYMVIFEAEGSLETLIHRIMAGETPEDIPGILSRHDSPLRVFQPAPLVHELDPLGFPKYEWIDIDLYRNFDGYQQTPIVLTRGCRWSRCSFCAERFLWRKRSPVGMVDEIEWLVNQGREVFVFNDSDLSGDPALVRAVCEEIIRRGIKAIFSGQLRVQKGYTKEYFDVLHQAGFRSLRYGVDAWAKNTLRLQKKGYTLQMIEETLGNTTAAGIEVTVNLVLGIPHETEEDIDEMIENIIKNRNRFSRIENINTLILAAGGVYWEEPEKTGVRFRGDKKELYQKYPKCIPPSLWYSEDPYIDQEVRLQRLDRLITALSEAGIDLGPYAAWKVRKLQGAS